MLPTLLPDKLMYWAEFAATEPTPTVAIIATWGWMLVVNDYEQRIYQDAIRIAQKVVAGELHRDWLEAEYVFYRGQDVYWSCWLHEDPVCIDDLTPDND